MSDRPYLTSAEAATYCGFKTIGGIQQAVRRGKLKPAGRRGGTGTYVFAREDLDSFLTGGLQPHERLFVPPEVNEAARLSAGAARPQAAKPRRPAKSPPAGSPPAAGSARAASNPIAAGDALPAANAAPEVAPKDGGKTAERPRRIAAGASAKPAAKPPSKRGRTTVSDDPVARIVNALSGASASSRRGKAAKRLSSSN